MHSLLFSILPKPLRATALMLFSTLLLAPSHSAQAADTWTDISSSLLERLTNNGAKAPWPGGCSGVVVNRTNAAGTIKVVCLGLWRRADPAHSGQRVDARPV